MSFGMDTVLLKDALALYVEELSAALPSEEECASVSFSPRFERRMERMLRDHQKFYYFWFNTLGKQVASVVLTVLMGMAIATFSVKALREPVVQFIIELFETFASYTVVQEDPPATLEFIATEPTYIPEGYTKVSQKENNTSCHIRYKGTNGEEINYRQRTISAGIGGVDAENAEYRKVIINGHEGFLRIKDNYSFIVFNSSSYIFTIGGMIEESELLKIVESIPLE